MKKVLLVLTLTLGTLVSNSQSFSEIENKIIDVFKTNYVEKKFKDPYSFKLLKIEVTPVNKGEFLLNDIQFMESNLNELYKYEPKEKVDNRLIQYRKQYAEMTDIEKLSIKQYKVRLDCYGNNSYGNPILGRYKFSISPDYNGGNLYVTELK